MLNKQNCWDYKKCGRGPCGVSVQYLGLCPVSFKKKLNNVNGGKNAGRSCWAIEGTLCDNKRQGNSSSKVKLCSNCGFYKLVMKEEKNNYTDTNQILNLLNS